MKNWLRIGSLLMFMAFTPAFAGNCDCKDDPLAKGGCGLKPEAMEDSNPFSEAACTAGESAFSSFEDAVTALFKSGAEDLDSTLVPKHKGELLDYLSCYRESDQQFCHFRKSLAPYVAYACKVTGFPLSIESCLLMKESSFDGSAKSDVGALGYSQLMSKTLKDLDKCFQYTQTGWTGEIDRVNREIADIKSGKAKLAKKDISPTLKMKETTLLIYRARRKVRKLWDDYWVGTKGNPCATGKIAITKGGCLKQEMANCYRYAPLLSMMKQTLDATMIAVAFLDEDYDQDPSNDQDSLREMKRVDGTLRVNGMSAMDTALFLTGAYNYGAPGFARQCGTKKTIKACIESFPKDSEPRQQMQGIRNCAQRHSFAPTQDPYNSKKRKSDCEQKKCYP